MAPDPGRPAGRRPHAPAPARSDRGAAEALAEQVTRELSEAVQELTRANREAEVLTELAAEANAAPTVHAGVAAVLAGICRYTGWPVGHAFRRSRTEDGVLVPLDVWYLDDPGRFAAFVSASDDADLPEGSGLPGRVLQQGRALWFPDLSQEEFPRQGAAAECGLRSAFGAPVLVRDRAEAVLEFFGTDVAAPDARVLRVAAFAGAQLGRVIEREAAEERLTRLALYDGLTGLPNRTLLMERLRGSLASGERFGSRVDVLYLDVDDFKTINDSQGHGAGDEVLVGVATRLQEAVRRSEQGGRRSLDTVGRLGGDEFAIVLDDCTNPAAVCGRILERMREPLRLTANEVFVSVSIGLVHADAASTAESLLAAANVALHEAKRSGKGVTVEFEPRMHTQAQRRHALGEELHRAIDNEELRLVYQPVVDLASERVIGAEALVRWAHPSGRTLAPAGFIARAEETGLIVGLGAWVLREACRQAARWRTHARGFTMAVNLSGRQLVEPGFRERVLETLREAALEPGALCLEMTESTLMERDDAGIEVLNRLRGDGLHLAIDDFGTGYSSLAALRRLPVDLLKIDRSFVASLPEDDDAGTIAWAVIGLGHTLKIPVLAEGVETVEQRAALRRFGCDQAQGFLFGRPVPAAEFTVPA